jgi:hypothetical protein
MTTAANELRRKAPALARFAALLDSHRRARGLTYAMLARALPSPRERSDGRAAANTVSNWCKGTALPTEIEPLLRVLFGADRDKEAQAREALRAAFNAAVAERHGAVISGASPASAAVSWTVAADNDRFVHDPAAEPSDEAAAAFPLQQQLQNAIRRMAAELAEMTAVRRDRFGNYATWKRLPDVASAFHQLVEREPSEIPWHLGDAYGFMLELAGFLEADMRLQKDPMASDPPLDADIHRPLSTMVQTAAPWLRGYPTVARLDDEAGRLLARPQLFQNAQEFARVAQGRGVIGADDAGRIDALAQLARLSRDDLARKSGSHAVADVYNLMLAVAELAAAALAGALPAARAGLARRSGRALADAQQDVSALAEASQSDLRQALQALAAEGRQLEQSEPAVLREASDPPVPEDVEGRARDMILRGEAPPVHWRPAIRRLNFHETSLADFRPLTGLTGLQVLDLSRAAVGDLSALAGLTGLQTLDLSESTVSDLPALAGLTRLQALDLSNTQVSDLSVLAGLTGLQTLDLAGTQVSDLSPLAGLTGLQKLSLGSAQAGSLSMLAELAGLRSLFLVATEVSDLSVLAELTGLQSLSLFGTQVSDLSVLAGLTGLQSLSLISTQVSDLSMLVGLPGLQSLLIRQTPVSDLSALARLTGLQSLSLDRTQVSDLSPLAGLTGLRRLYLGDEAADPSPFADRKDLEIIQPRRFGTSRARRAATGHADSNARGPAPEPRGAGDN